MATNKKVLLKLTKREVAYYLYNSTLQDVVQSEMSIAFWALKEAMAKPNTPDKTDAINKRRIFEKKLYDDSLKLEVIQKKLEAYEKSTK